MILIKKQLQKGPSVIRLLSPCKAHFDRLQNPKNRRTWSAPVIAGPLVNKKRILIVLFKFLSFLYHQTFYLSVIGPHEWACPGLATVSWSLSDDLRSRFELRDVDSVV
jgi:hypothetical protein